MLVKTLTALLASLHITSALAGQVPIVNGVPGGVRKTTKTEGDAAFVKLPHSDATITPGKLRVTENSGICGTWFPSHLSFDFALICLAQKLLPVFIRLLVMLI